MSRKGKNGHKFQGIVGESAGSLVDEIMQQGQTQGLNNVFTTFLEITAVCFRAATDVEDADKWENRYQEIIKGMKAETLSAYAKMMTLLYLAVSENMEAPCDILGTIYHELNLNNEWNGQFFTPDNVCRMMASMINPVDEDIAEKEGFVSINEPTCGSGTMVIGAVWAMQKSHFDYQNKSIFVAQDIDIRCVWMTYIQMFLYRIPAIIIHGNTLTLEEWSRWVTPYVVLPLSRRDSILKMKDTGGKTNG